MFQRTFEQSLQVDYKRWGIDQSLAQLILNELSLKMFNQEYRDLRGTSYQTLKNYHQDLIQLFNLLKGETDLTARKFQIAKYSWIPNNFKAVLLNPNGTIVATPPENLWKEIWDNLLQQYPQLQVKDFKIIEKILCRTFYRKDYLQSQFNYPQFSHFINALKLEFNHPEIYRLFLIIEGLKGSTDTKTYLNESKRFN